jgi:hypothetical protein
VRNIRGNCKMLDKLTDFLDYINQYSGALCFFTLIVLCYNVSKWGEKIINEIKFIHRRDEILLVNDNLKHIPRDLNGDYFTNKEDNNA